jgi:hypothetical protein
MIAAAMRIASRLPIAALCLVAAEARGAALSWVSAFRQIECGVLVASPAATFGGFDESLVSMREVPGQPPRPDSSASQMSVLELQTILVSSRISGETTRGASFFQVYFDLDEASPFRVTGSIELLGSAGFACVSLVNLAQTATPLVHEVMLAPPPVSESRDLLFSGTLEPGRYAMEAMIYGGGDNRATRGKIDVVFSIPEPGTGSLAAAAGLVLLRRRRVS